MTLFKCLIAFGGLPLIVLNSLLATENILSLLFSMVHLHLNKPLLGGFCPFGSAHLNDARSCGPGRMSPGEPSLEPVNRGVVEMNGYVSGFPVSVDKPLWRLLGEQRSLDCRT